MQNRTSSNIQIASKNATNVSGEHNITLSWILENVWNLPKYFCSKQHKLTIDCSLLWMMEVQLLSKPRTGLQKGLVLKTRLHRIDSAIGTVQAHVGIFLMNEQDILYEGLCSSTFSEGCLTSSSTRTVCFQKQHLLSLPDDVLTLRITIKTEGCCSNIGTGSETSLKQFTTIESCPAMFNDFRTALDNQLLPNVIFKTSDGPIHANKFILSARSSVFRNLFRNENTEAHIVHVTDPKQSKAVKVFVSYLYTGLLCDLSVEMAYTLYELACEYDIKVLQQTCSYLLTGKIESSNVCKFLKLAHKHSDQYLKDITMRFISRNYCEVEHAEGWEKMMEIDPLLLSEVFNVYCMQTALHV